MTHDTPPPMREDPTARDDELMTGAQRAALAALSDEAGVPYEDHLSRADAARRIDELQKRTGRGLQGRAPDALDAESQTIESGETEADAHGGDLRGVVDR
jgi:hypothetical protein